MRAGGCGDELARSNLRHARRLHRPSAARVGRAALRPSPSVYRCRADPLAGRESLALCGSRGAGDAEHPVACGGSGRDEPRRLPGLASVQRDPTGYGAAGAASRLPDDCHVDSERLHAAWVRRGLAARGGGCVHRHAAVADQRRNVGGRSADPAHRVQRRGWLLDAGVPAEGWDCCCSSSAASLSCCSTDGKRGSER